MLCKIQADTIRYNQICTAFKIAYVHVFMTKIHTHMHCLSAMHMCMYLHVCWHVHIQHTCTYALDTAPMSQDTCRYSQIHADTGMRISNVYCEYEICIELYPVHMSVHMCAVCGPHTCTYINPYVCQGSHPGGGKRGLLQEKKSPLRQAGHGATGRCRCPSRVLNVGLVFREL